MTFSWRWCSSHHVHDSQVSVAEYDGIGWVGNWEKEGVGGAQCGGDQDVEWVHLDGFCLRTDTQDGNNVTSSRCWTSCLLTEDK